MDSKYDSKNTQDEEEGFVQDESHTHLRARWPTTLNTKPDKYLIKI